MKASYFSFSNRRAAALLHWNDLVLPVALLLALVTRLVDLHLVEFRYDEVQAIDMATQILTGRALPATGIGSSLPGLPNPPFFEYLLVLPRLVSSAPEVASGFVALLNIGALLVTVWLARSFFGRVAATICALLYAVLPWAVIFSRKIWGQDAMPFFLVLALALMWIAIQQEKPVLLVPGVGLFALATQLHLSVFALAPLWGFALLAPGNRLRRLPYLLGGLILAAVLYAPYLVWQTQHGWPLIADRSSGLGGNAWSLEAFLLAGETVAGQPYTAMANLGRLTWLGVAWELARRLLLVALALGLLRLVRMAIRDRQRRWQALFLLAWLILPVLVFVRPRVPLYTHYFISAIPAAIIIMAAGFDLVLSSRPGPGTQISKAEGQIQASSAGLMPRWIAAAIVGGIVVVGAAFFAIFMQAVERDQVTTDYGPPLAASRETIAVAQQALATRGGRLYVAGDKEDAAVFRYLLLSDGTPVSQVKDDFFMAVPRQQTALYLVGGDSPLIEQVLLDRLHAQPLVTLQPMGSPRRVRLIQVPDGALSQEFTSRSIRPVGQTFANGMELLAEEAQPQGHQLHLTLYWQVSGEASGSAPQVFNHLLIDPTRDKVAQADGTAFSPVDWRSSDILVTPFTIDLPTAIGKQVWIRTGLYYLDAPGRVQLRSGGEYVDVGPFDLSAAGGGS